MRTKGAVVLLELNLLWRPQVFCLIIILALSPALVWEAISTPPSPSPSTSPSTPTLTPTPVLLLLGCRQVVVELLHNIFQVQLLHRVRKP